METEELVDPLDTYTDILTKVEVLKELSFLDVEATHKNTRTYLISCWNYLIDCDNEKLNWIIDQIKPSLPKFSEWYNEHFDKMEITISQWFICYARIVESLDITEETKINKVKSFFREEGCQKLFNKIKKVKNLQTTPRAQWLVADHIISQSVLYHFAEKYHSFKYTYDFLIVLRTITNKCYNFQQLTIAQNSVKSKIEVELITLINDNNYEEFINIVKSNKNYKNYFAYYYTNSILKRGKNYMNVLKGLKARILDFLTKIEIDITNLNNINNKRCICQICLKSSETSKKFKSYYAFIYLTINDENAHNIINPTKFTHLNQLYQDYYKSRIELKKRTITPF